MAQWVPQNEFSSVTAAARSRTAYLAPLIRPVLQAIEDYIASEPDGEEVTLAVLREIGEEPLRQASQGRSFDRAKQDVGLLVAQSLVDLYGASCVHTLRRDDRKAVSARRNTWSDLGWVRNYAPHRILPARSLVERIFLDTSVVRQIIHGDRDALDLDALKASKGDHPVSIADGALAELASQLLRGSVDPGEWAVRISALDAVLDSDFPVAPGGKELAALWGAHSRIGFDVGEARAYYRAAWAYLRGVRKATDLSKKAVFHAPSGHAYAIRLDQEHVEAVLAEAGSKWANWVTNVSGLIRGIRKDGDKVSEKDLRQLTLSNLCLDMGVADAVKLDLVIHVMAKRAMQASTASVPYNPKGKPNDALDLDLLFGIPLPGWVCTADDRLCRLVRSTDSHDHDKVMTPQGLLERLKAQKPAQ